MCLILILNHAVKTSSRSRLLLYFFHVFGYYFIYYCSKFVYMQLACNELPLLPLAEINSGFPQGIQDNWCQNRSYLNNYVCKLQ